MTDQEKPEPDPDEDDQAAGDGFPMLTFALTAPSRPEAAEVPSEWLAEWAAETEAATLRIDDHPGGVIWERIDLPATLAKHGMLGDEPLIKIVITNCRAVQVGDHNEQHIHLRLDIRKVKLVLDQGLLKLLSGSGREPSRSPGFTGGKLADRSPRTATESYERPTADGRAYVVVRRSQGVQIGDHSTQRAQFDYTLMGPKLYLGGDIARTLLELHREGTAADVRRFLADQVRLASFSFERGPTMVALDRTQRIHRRHGVSAGRHNKQIHTTSLDVNSPSTGQVISQLNSQERPRGIAGPGL
ncbi:hypothetical protein M8542_32205 [Amycolatopsis sp. OK19-0408]|uniref:Uncharacterized protein n=1 Tax=Amycolatopsis iheyensis TaxID=2945988 RepID=A0A9X2NMC4_9PSEU|nr:RIP homotypic interaction motif-containing protein [Amycolatopsis iheyensis]MCR6487500.1 hypothetical protein [Amycolatopsis iheyensis]